MFPYMVLIDSWSGSYDVIAVSEPKRLPAFNYSQQPLICK